ncbi:MAG: L-seryl-tRNA(Sec) selenium transferase [Dehalococcoidia bacterium]|nr:L-seryl-tRNA(Sec) selenium transferase [Dehalococcoidia bacterium]
MADPRLRALPSVETLLVALRAAAPGVPHAVAAPAARDAIAAARARIRAGEPAPLLEELVAAAAATASQATRSPLRRVINASGVLLQTNMGRAPLSDRTLAAVAELGVGYTNLELDVDRGERGSRHEHVRAILRQLTGAEDALVVNNNAAAVMMALQVLARGGEVIVSRGQAVEIGGGFRIPDIVAQSGARLVEVGTTNRTYARDYEAAIGDETMAILRVHPSNFRVVGFTAEPSLAELAALEQEHGVPLLDDLGSGCLVDTARFGLPHEPTIQESVAGGASLVFASGDKLLGGPQAGIIAGRAELVARLRAHPLARALRVDKLTIAALLATLASYAEGRECEEIPIWRMLSLPLPGLRRRAQRWATAAGDGARVVEALSLVGGGSLPDQGVPSWVTAIRGAGRETALAAALRAADPPIIARVERGTVLLDPRTVDQRDDQLVAARLRELSGVPPRGGA